MPLFRAATLGALLAISAAPAFDAEAQAQDARDRHGAQPSLDRMIGQMIMVGVLGTKPSDPGVKAVMGQLRSGTIGGVILMGRNITSPRQLKRLTRALHAAGEEGGQRTLISVDQEGGHVQRLKSKNGHESFPYSAKTVAERCYPDESFVIYRNMACQLRESGININFGPVVDLDLAGGRNPIIGKLRRSYSRDPEQVIEYARSFGSAHKQYGILTSAKHYPGHGNSLTDSHKGFTSVAGRLTDAELEPYRSLAAENYADMVMVGHLYHPDFSDGRAPTSLSRKAIRQKLRTEIGFRGVVITDDLQMRAVLDHYPLGKRVARAINAGNDILLLSNTYKAYARLGTEVHKLVKRAVRDKCPPNSASSCIPRNLIVRAYARIRDMKGPGLDQFYDNQFKSCRALGSVAASFKRSCTKPQRGRQNTRRDRSTSRDVSSTRPAQRSERSGQSFHVNQIHSNSAGN